MIEIIKSLGGGEIFILAVLYFLPTILVHSALISKNRPQNYFFLNLFFGWTVIVWVGLIVEFFIFNYKQSLEIQKQILLKEFSINPINQKK